MDSVVWVTASSLLWGPGQAWAIQAGWQESHESPVTVRMLEPRSLKMSAARDPGRVSGNSRPVSKTSFSFKTTLMGDRAKLALVGE